MKQKTPFERLANSLRQVVCVLVVAVMCSGCGPDGPQEVAVPWDNFASTGWYAADPEEYGDCAAGMEQLGESEATSLQFAFNMQGLNFATYRNHEVAVADWTDRQALVVDVENQAPIPLGIALFLSNEETEPVWHQSMRHPLPVGAKETVRFGLRPASKGEGAPKDWPEDAWQFIKLDLTDIRRVAVRVYAAEGTDGVKGKVVVSNPRFMKLAEAK